MVNDSLLNGLRQYEYIMNALRYIACGAFFTDNRKIFFKDKSLVIKTETLMESLDMCCTLSDINMLYTPELYDLTKFLKAGNYRKFIKDGSLRCQKKTLKALDAYKRSCTFMGYDDTRLYIKFYHENGYGIDNRINYDEQLKKGNIITAPSESTGMSAGYIDHAFDYAKDLKFGSKILLIKLLEDESYIRHTYEILGYRYEVIKTGSLFDTDFLKSEVLPEISQDAKNSFFKGISPDNYSLDNFASAYGDIKHFIGMSEKYGRLSELLEHERARYTVF
ncbi:hypothetical protein [Butyrivibrio sp. AE3004]|uniref:hypothetical protein n=1 Tax=Butyrivibrio sp. AE3004 TaxID=1506994 RepID=UPI000493F4FA|nr:hypothetical protein [Butyrivibrio sp. AE3004]